MLNNSDLKVLYKDDKAKQYCKMKWAVVFGIMLMLIASVIYYISFNSQPIEQQLSQTVFFMNKLTFMGLMFSIITGLLMVAYLYLEMRCVDIIIDSRHSSLKQRVKACLTIDRRERQEEERKEDGKEDKGGDSNVKE